MIKYWLCAFSRGATALDFDLVGTQRGNCTGDRADQVSIFWMKLKISKCSTGLLLLGKCSWPTEPQVWMLLGHTVVGKGRQVNINIFFKEANFCQMEKTPVTVWTMFVQVLVFSRLHWFPRHRIWTTGFASKITYLNADFIKAHLVGRILNDFTFGRIRESEGRKFQTSGASQGEVLHL